MKINSLFLKTILFSLIVASCEDPNYPDSVWDENDTGNATPSISSVEPASGAFAGIDTITITGQNFSAVSYTHLTLPTNREV